MQCPILRAFIRGTDSPVPHMPKKPKILGSMPSVDVFGHLLNHLSLLDVQTPPGTKYNSKATCVLAHIEESMTIT